MIWRNGTTPAEVSRIVGSVGTSEIPSMTRCPLLAKKSRKPWRRSLLVCIVAETSSTHTRSSLKLQSLLKRPDPRRRPQLGHAHCADGAGEARRAFQVPAVEDARQEAGGETVAGPESIERVHSEGGH